MGFVLPAQQNIAYAPLGESGRRPTGSGVENRDVGVERLDECLSARRVTTLVLQPPAPSPRLPDRPSARRLMSWGSV